MDTVHIVLGITALAAIVGVVWLLIERGRLSSARGVADARTDSERERADRAQAELDEREAELREHDERLDRANTDLARLTEQMEGERRAHTQALEALRERESQRAEHERRTREELEQRYKDGFEALAAKTLEQSSERFMQRATEAFKAHHEKSDAAFDAKSKSISELVAPIKEALTKTDEKLAQIDKGRVETSAALKQHLELLSQQTTGLKDQTEHLVRSLKAPHVRGKWGELQLRRIVELAGMSAHCDFDEQAHVAGDEDGSRLRPDMIVRLPGDRCVIVDAKASLVHYLEAIEAETDAQKADRLKAHARAVRSRVDDLASKSYQTRLEQAGMTPDFAVLFVPGDQFLSAALLEQPDLLEHAASKSIILTTPATLIALLKAVSFGWAQASFADDAKEIIELATMIHDRVRVVSEHLDKVGTHLGRTVNSYNDAVGSLERNLLPGARRIGEYEVIASKKQVAELEPVLTEPKRPTPEDAPEPRFGFGVDQPDQAALPGGDGETGVDVDAR